MAAGTFTVRGHKVRTGSQRRYVVFGCRRPDRTPMETVTHGDGSTTIQAADPSFTPSASKPRIVKRSDSLATAERARQRYDGRDSFAVTIGTTTGWEV